MGVLLLRTCLYVLYVPLKTLSVGTLGLRPSWSAGGTLACLRASSMSGLILGFGVPARLQQEAS